MRTVYDEGVHQEKVDAILIGYARGLNRIFLSYDELKAQSGAEVAAELTLRGGKVIQIRGGPEQPTLRALGRLLFHHADWYSFLENNDGIAIISDIKRDPKLLTPDKYSQTFGRTNRVHFIDYMQAWHDKQRAPVRTRARRRRATQNLI